MSLFIDTSAFYALLDRDDQFHESAKQVWVDGLDGQEQMVTHNYVTVETHALVQARLGMAAVRTFEDDLLAPVDLCWIDKTLHNQAIEAHLSADERNVSLVDRISFLLMRKRGIPNAFCFDADFETHGVQVRP